MDDFDGEEYIDDEEEYEQEDDRSLKEKYDDAKEKYDKIKEKYDKYKEKNSNPQADAKKFNESLRAGNKAGSEAGKQAAKEGSKQAGKEAAKTGAKEAGKQAGKEAGKQAAKEVGKQAGKEAAKTGAKVAAEGAAASTGVGIVVAAGIEVADRLNEIKKKVDKKVDKKIEETTGIKNASKKRKFILPLAIIAIILLLFVVPAAAMFSVSETASSDLKTLVKAREETNKKELILFTKSELNELLKKDITLSDDVVKKLTDDGYIVEEDKKSYSYKSILKNYGKDMSEIFFTTALDKLSDDLKEDIKDDTDTNEAEKVSLAQAKKYLMCEINNFNKVNWKTSILNANYGISGKRKSSKYEGDNAYNSYLNDPNKVSGISGEMTSSSVAADYEVKDENGKKTMLKTPKFSDLRVEGDNNETALSFVKMLSPYMQKWIIPYSIMIDTQDEEFVNGIINNIYHPVDVSLFQLKKLVKNVTFEYYMECFTYREVRTVYKNGLSSETLKTEIVPNSMQFEKNTKDETPGEHYLSEKFIGEETIGEKTYKKYEQTYKIVKLNATNDIAKDSSGKPMVKSVKIERKLENAETLPEITYIGAFYEIIEKNFSITAIDETQSPNESSTGNMSVNEKNGIGTQVLTESWKESIVLNDSKTTEYELSYMTQEQLDSLDRRVSIIEWYQDSKSMVGGQDGEGGGAGSASATQQQYIDSYKDAALQDMNESGVLASITLAQGILESGSGKSKLASQYNNHFGIKAGDSWKGATATMRTAEYDSSGAKYHIDAKFRAYASAADSFADHSRFVWNTKGHSTKAGGFRYRDSTEFAKSMSYTAPDGQSTYNYRGAIQAIVDGGYCTDPSYVSKICSIIETYKLYEIDRQSTWDGTPPEYAETGSDSAGASGSSSGSGNTIYSYEDMEFAFYQIEKWYEEHSTGDSALNLSDRVVLPEGGFAWPVKVTDSNSGAKSIYRFYGVTLDQGSTHKGLDIYTGDVGYYDSDSELHKGELVVSTHDGIITKVQPVVIGDETKCAYIEIKTEDGKFKTKYMYLSEIYVNEGDTVTKNQVIGRIGKTGAHSTDTDLYLHYEIYYKGENTDPLTYYNLTQNGNKVDNYADLDLSTVTNPKEFQYESSKLYIGGNSDVVNFAMQFLGYRLSDMNAVRGTSFSDHWCAWFASWCLRECGIDVIECSNTNYCPTIWNETKGVKHKYGDGYVPNPGDIIMFYSPSSSRYSHIAIVSKVENGVVYWIGGNQGGNCPHGSKVTENSRDSRLKSYITY